MSGKIIIHPQHAKLHHNYDGYGVVEPFVKVKLGE